MREFFGRAFNIGKKIESHNRPETSADRLTQLAHYQARLFDAVYAKTYPDGRTMKKYSDVHWNEKDMREWDKHRADYHPYVASGSRSGSLYGFVRARGLLPTGELLKKTDIVPFSGELGQGISNYGINNTALSFSADVSVALEYAHKYPKPWSLKGSEEYIRRIDESFKNFDNDVKEYFSNGELFVSHDQIKTIEKRRQEIWYTLSAEEQSFISQPFPVVYGVVEQNTLKPQPENNFKFIPGLSEPHLKERVWEGELSADQFNTTTPHGRLVVYVPELYIKKVADYFKKNTIDIHVRSLEVLTLADTQRTIEEKLHDIVDRYVDNLLKPEAYALYSSWNATQNGNISTHNLIPVIANTLISGDWRKGDEAIDHALHIWQKTGIIKSSLPEKQAGLLRDLIKKCFANFSDLP